MNELVTTVEHCLLLYITGKSQNAQKMIIKNMQKQLVEKEEMIITAFAIDNQALFIDLATMDNQLKVYFLMGSWRATFGVLARSIIDLLKYNMYSDSAKEMLEMEDIVGRLFSNCDVSSLHPLVIIECIYYIAGWHIIACFKVGKKRKGNLREVMISLFFMILSSVETLSPKSFFGILTVYTDDLIIQWFMPT